MKISCRNFVKKALIWLLITTTASLCLVPALSVSAEQESEDNQSSEVSLSDDSYFSYFLKYNKSNRPSESISGVTNSVYTSLDGKEAVIFSESNKTAEFTFDIKEEGAYNLNLNYRTVESDTADILLSVMLDGKAPYTEAGTFELYKIYSDEETTQDKYGNDVRPVSKEVVKWIEASISDSTGLYGEPYIFYLTAGVHTVSITTQNSIGIASVSFQNKKEAISYAEYAKKYKDYKSGESVRQEAELIYEKNSTMLYPTYDHADASTMPSDAAVIKLNTIGQANWSNEGQFISWKANVKKAGVYKLSFRANQNFNESGASCRKLLINGEAPFKEAENIEFPYANSWYIKTLGDENPYYIYLEPGDIITLQCVSDTTSEISRSINNVLSTLSRIYREIIVVTGSAPDAYRDYNLDVKIPTLVDELKEAEDMLENSITLITNRTGKSSSAVSTLKQTKETITNMIERVYEIQNQVSNLSGNIESIGSLVMTVGQQPLELDCIYFTEKEAKLPKVSISIFKKIAYGAKRFIVSFSDDYNLLEDDTNKIKVWVATGRDQLQILQRMIEDDYENSHNVKIQLSLVDTGATLIQATLAGKGPDVAFGIASSQAIDLAVRDALVDLKPYGIDEIYDDFHTSAWTPLDFDGEIFAIPETQGFDMLFYRTDIFEELGLEVPNTWDEFYDVIEVLQRNNLEIGVPEVGANAGISDGTATFSRFLLQNGGTFYTEDHRKTAFDTDEAYLAFRSWVELYNKYGLDRSFNFFNRFRTGIMPLAIQNYGAYAQVYSAAPEIRGLWSMVQIPGTKMEDGTINRSENSSVTGCIMLNSAKKKGIDKDAYEFMKWWTSADSQTRYARELELSMGVAARYAPANKEALAKIGWSDNEYKVISSQRDSIINFKEVPGNYIIGRALTSAFRNALTSTELPERQLELYNKDINEELARKAKEFNLY